MKGCVYRIYCKDPEVLDCYIGSTIQGMNKRMMGHKRDIVCSNSPNYCAKKAQFMRDNGGWAKWSHEVLEDVCVSTLQELRVREQHWIDQTPTATLNGAAAWLPECERGVTAWRARNTEKYSSWEKVWRQNNRRQIAETKKAHYQAHIEEILAQKKNYYQENKARIIEKVVCQHCGATVARSSMTRHQRRPICLNNRKKQQD